MGYVVVMVSGMGEDCGSTGEDTFDYDCGCEIRKLCWPSFTAQEDRTEVLKICPGLAVVQAREVGHFGDACRPFSQPEA